MGGRSPPWLCVTERSDIWQTPQANFDEVFRRADLDYDETEKRKRFSLRPTVAKKCKYSL